MIKPSDLKIKLDPFRHKRIADINGLSLYISGGKRGTTYLFQQRLRINGKYTYITIKTKDLNEARKVALDNINNIDSLDTRNISLTQCIEDFNQYYNKSDLRPNTLYKFSKVYKKHLIPASKDILLKDITPKLLFNLFIKPSLDKGYYDMVSYIQTKLNQIIELARVNYTHVNIPEITCMRRLYKMPKEENHLPMVEDINSLVNIRITKPNIKCLYELSFHLLLRPSEMVSIKIKDIDFDTHILNVPKTKTTTDFKVPLSKQALIIIYIAKQLKTNDDNPYLFEGVKQQHANSETINHLLNRNGFKGKQTSHSIRAIGRTWFEKNNIKYEVAETCLSHKVGDSTYRAYVRTDYLDERREVMQLWSNYISSQFQTNSIIYYFLD